MNTLKSPYQTKETNTTTNLYPPQTLQHAHLLAYSSNSYIAEIIQRRQHCLYLFISFFFCTWVHCSLLLSAAKSLQMCLTLCDPRDGSPPGFPVLGFSRQEHWSGLPFPSPMHESEKWKWSHSVVSESCWPHGLQPTRLLRPWDFPGKSTGVGCHRLLQERGLEAVNVSLEIREHLPKFTAHPIQDCRANFVIRH